MNLATAGAATLCRSSSSCLAPLKRLPRPVHGEAPPVGQSNGGTAAAHARSSGYPDHSLSTVFVISKDSLLGPCRARYLFFVLVVPHG